MRIIFFGTSRFAKIVLESLLTQTCEVIAIVTRPDKPLGRSLKPGFSPVKSLALQRGIPLYQPSKASDPVFVDLLQGYNADFFVVAAYAEILKENVLQLPKIASINIHGSLLPKYRGAAPVQRSIIEGEKESGITIMKMAAQLDAGDILAIRTTPIPPDMNAGELMDLLAHLSKEALWSVLEGLVKGNIHPVAQDPLHVSYAKKLSPEEGQINWQQKAKCIHNQVRGFTPNPGAWCWVEIRKEKKRLLVKKTLIHTAYGLPGEILPSSKSELIVGCAESSLSLLEIQLEGKKRLTAAEFLRGIPANNIKFLLD